MASVYLLGDVTAACSLTVNIYRNLYSEETQAKYDAYREQLMRLQHDIAVLSDIVSEYCESDPAIASLLDDINSPSAQAKDPDNWENGERCTTFETCETGYMDRHTNLQTSRSTASVGSFSGGTTSFNKNNANNMNINNADDREDQLWTNNISLRVHRLLLSSNGRMKAMAGRRCRDCLDDDDPLV